MGFISDPDEVGLWTADFFYEIVESIKFLGDINFFFFFFFYITLFFPQSN